MTLPLGLAHYAAYAERIVVGVSEEERLRWDERHRARGIAPVEDVGLPSVFAGHESLVPTEGFALEIACGRGGAAVWLAKRGLRYLGIDVSAVAIDLARKLVESVSLEKRCEFIVHDLDLGLPETPPADVLLCHMYRNRSLNRLMVQRLNPGGVLFMAVLSEVGGQPGRHTAKRGELLQSFDELDVLAHGEGDGKAWLIGRKS